MNRNLALYRTTAAVLSSAVMVLAAAWLLAAAALLAAVVHEQANSAVLLCIVLLVSAYCHLRVALDAHLLRGLARQELGEDELDAALQTLRLRKPAPVYTAEQRAAACLRWFYRSVFADGVLCLLSIIVMCVI